MAILKDIILQIIKGRGVLIQPSPFRTLRTFLECSDHLFYSTVFMIDCRHSCIRIPASRVVQASKVSCDVEKVGCEK